MDQPQQSESGTEIESNEVATLPPALAHLVELVSQDRLRSTSRTAYLIVGLGPDDVERHIDALAVASGGSGGPTLEEWRDALDLGRQVMEPGAEKIEEQHVVSKVLLKQFTARRKSGPELISFDLAYGTTKPKSPRSVGKMIDFVKIDSKRTEELWAEVETKLHSALEAVHDGSLFDHSDHVETLKDALALHFARSLEIRRLHHKIWDQQLDSFADAASQVSALVAVGVEHGYGGVRPPGLTDRDVVLDVLARRSRDLFEDGVLFRLRVSDLFEQARDLARRAGLQIGRVERGELLIGDVPALTVGRDGGIGPAEGAPFSHP